MTRMKIDHETRYWLFFIILGHFSRLCLIFHFDLSKHNRYFEALLNHWLFLYTTYLNLEFQHHPFCKFSRWFYTLKKHFYLYTLSFLDSTKIPSTHKPNLNFKNKQLCSAQYFYWSVERGRWTCTAVKCESGIYVSHAWICPTYETDFVWCSVFYWLK